MTDSRLVSAAFAPPSLPDARLLLSAETIQTRLAGLAQEIETFYQDRDFVLIGVLNGAWVFVADLARQLRSARVEVDFLRARKFRENEDFDAPVEILLDCQADVRGREVLLVEDIADTGDTLVRLVTHLREKGAQDVKVCVFLDKPERRRESLRETLKIDFCGFEIPDRWVFGYGLDDNRLHRHLPHLYHRTPETETEP
jgi:hypoxanthine phosphoribosyltransferase